MNGNPSKSLNIIDKLKSCKSDVLYLFKKMHHFEMKKKVHQGSKTWAAFQKESSWDLISSVLYATLRLLVFFHFQIS